MFSDEDWVPIGLGYHEATEHANGFITRKIESSHLLKDDFELVQACLFDDYSDFKNAVDLVEKLSKYH